MKKAIWSAVYVLIVFWWVHITWGDFYAKFFMCITMGVIVAKITLKYIGE